MPTASASGVVAAVVTEREVVPVRLVEERRDVQHLVGARSSAPSAPPFERERRSGGVPSTACSSPPARRRRVVAVVPRDVDGDRVEQPTPAAHLREHPDRPGGPTRAQRASASRTWCRAGGRCRRRSRRAGSVLGAGRAVDHSGWTSETARRARRVEPDVPDRIRELVHGRFGAPVRHRARAQRTGPAVSYGHRYPFAARVIGPSGVDPARRPRSVHRRGAPTHMPSSWKPCPHHAPQKCTPSTAVDLLEPGLRGERPRSKTRVGVVEASAMTCDSVDVLVAVEADRGIAASRRGVGGSVMS